MRTFTDAPSGEEIQYLLDKYKLSRSAFARLIHVSRATLFYWLEKEGSRRVSKMHRAFYELALLKLGEATVDQLNESKKTKEVTLDQSF